MSWGKKLQLENTERVRATLPMWDKAKPLTVNDASSDLRLYFSTYGFTELFEKYPAIEYRMGFIPVAQRRIATHVWRNDQARATVLVAHGLFDHVGLFVRLVDTLLSANFSVVAIDFPGHGLSDGESAVIKDFAEYGDAIKESIAVLKNTLPNPWYALAQSTGGAAVLHYMLRGEAIEFNKVVLFAPLIQPTSWPLVKLTFLLLHKFLNSVPRSFTVNSHDPEFCDFLKYYDPLQPRRISTLWTGAMKKWIENFDDLPQSEVPTLIIQGDNDGTVDWRKNLPRIQRKLSNAEVYMIEGAMHHLSCEADAWRQEAYDRAIAYFSA